MFMPSVFGENLFDDWMDFAFPNSKRSGDIMKTDIKELDKSYEFHIDLPGIKKEDVKAKLEDGYLTIQAGRSYGEDEKDSDGKYIRRERYVGTMSRSFYVGEGVQQEDVHAKFEDGILKLTVPKMDKKAVEEKRYISIEG